MQKVLLEAVEREIESGLARVAPAFSLGEGNIPAGCGIFTAKIAPKLDAYLFFQPHRKMNAFTFEIACSTEGQWPAYFLREPSDLYELTSGEIRFRLSRLWGASDFWWQVGALRELPEVVEDVMEKVKLYALPYLSRMAGKQ